MRDDFVPCELCGNEVRGRAVLCTRCDDSLSAEEQKAGEEARARRLAREVREARWAAEKSAAEDTRRTA